MNVITIRGGRKSQRALVQSAIEFSLSKLLPRTTSLDIEVRLNHRIEGAEGFCLAEDHKTFELEIDPRISDKDLALTVFHEMVHVRQFFKRQLRDEAFGNVKTWLGKMYNEDKVKYLNLPWEKEAFKLQEVLFKQFAKPQPVAKRKVQNTLYTY